MNLDSLKLKEPFNNMFIFFISLSLFIYFVCFFLDRYLPKAKDTLVEKEQKVLIVYKDENTNKIYKKEVLLKYKVYTDFSIKTTNMEINQ